MKNSIKEAFTINSERPTTLMPQTHAANLLLNFLLGLDVGNISINYGPDSSENRASGLVFETTLEARVARFTLNLLFLEI